MVSTFTANKNIEKPGNNDYINTWNVPVNSDWDIIDKAFGGTFSVSLSNSNVTLTQANVQNVCISLSGTLSANVTVYFPSGVSGFYFVRNATSGSYAVTLASAGGSPGTSIPSIQGGITFIWSDGSNVIYASNPQNGAPYTYINTQTFSGSPLALASIQTNIAEPATISAIAATGTINFDVTTQSVLYYTSNATANWTVNFRGSSATPLNTLMTTGQSLTVVFLVQCGSTPYYNNAITIDGTSVTPVWQGAYSPTAGIAASLNVYTYTIFKTGSSTFKVLAALTQYA
jgi:hypothetical protein